MLPAQIDLRVAKLRQGPPIEGGFCLDIILRVAVAVLLQTIRDVVCELLQHIRPRTRLPELTLASGTGFNSVVVGVPTGQVVTDDG